MAFQFSAPRDLLESSSDSEDEAPVPRTPAPSAVFTPKKAEQHELAIRPVKTAAKLEALPDRHENVLRPPFLLLVNGGVRSGKSCLIANLAYRREYYRGVFDKIILISPTAHADPTFRAFNEDPKAEVHAPDSPASLDASISHVIAEAAPGGEPDGQTRLVIVDDCAAFVRNGDQLCGLCTRYRHYGISLIVSAQYYLRLPPVIRTNATAIVVFKVANTRERGTIFDEQASTFGDALPQKYAEVFEAKGAPRYCFIVLDLRRRAILENFEKVIYEH